MVSSLNSPPVSPTHSISHPHKNYPSSFYVSNRKNHHISCNYNQLKTSTKSPLQLLRNFCLPFAVSSLVFCSNPAQAGFLSGLAGIESVPGPKLPSVEFLDRYNEDYKKKYAENDERIKSSPIIKELLERSKLNKEKNKQEIMDKYCLRGAEWGVGDCSTEGMTPDERDAFISMLKKKAGVE